MPIPVRFTYERFPGRTFIVDLNYARFNWQGTGINILRKIANAETADKVQPELQGLAIRNALQVSPLSIISSDGVPTERIREAAMSPRSESGREYRFDNVGTARLVIRNPLHESFHDGIHDSPNPSVRKMIALSESVMALYVVIVSKGTYQPILSNARISWVGDQTGDDDMMFVPSGYPRFVNPYDNSTLIARRDAMVISNTLNPSGNDGINGPIFGFLARKEERENVPTYRKDDMNVLTFNKEMDQSGIIATICDSINNGMNEIKRLRTEYGLDPLPWEFEMSEHIRIGIQAISALCASPHPAQMTE